VSHAANCLQGDAPVIAATDYVRAWPQLIASHVSAPYTVLGTDGFGRSDTREELRKFFEVNRGHIVLAALTALRHQGHVSAQACQDAIGKFGLATDDAAPWLN
jgi:pyruvate dehydrogenase E1 component